ncbi:medium chain dehydrogenase/reductase family protein [Bacillus sp. CGMCC 1.16607]|uniref:medium chain dehydrogenase/reductase family protein n=1 Tax=Bacillus sp. CGMCC 1.16607 TaxID=3351842 RepID=UPI0036436C94
MYNQRIIITEIGQLKLIEECLLELNDNEVRVKVLVTGVAFADIMMRKGKYPGVPDTPFTPGHEVVGIVESIGRNVTSVKVGQMVAAFCKYGGYTRYIHLHEQSMLPIPTGINPYTVVAMLLNYLTAYQLLFRVAKVQEGNSLLIHGAAGGVGTALLQLSQEINLELYGTASLKNKKKVLSMGAKYIDYQSEDFVERIATETSNGVDFVFDSIGGYHWNRSYRTLKPNGLFVGYGLAFANQDHVNFEEKRFMMEEWNRILTTNKTSSGHKGHFYSISKVQHVVPHSIKEDLTQLIKLLSQNKINPIISHKIPLSQAIEAHQLFESGVDGKILLLCNYEGE